MPADILLTTVLRLHFRRAATSSIVRYSRSCATWRNRSRRSTSSCWISFMARLSISIHFFRRFLYFLRVQSESDLWAAVLLRGVCDYFLFDVKDRRAPRLQRDAREWIFDDRIYPGFFRFCADICGLDPRAVRSQLQKLSHDQFRRQLHPLMQAMPAAVAPLDR